MIFLEVSNLTTYSQFYDIRVGDHIIKKIYQDLRRHLGRKVYLYRTDQIVIIREFENRAVINHTLRQEEQYRTARKIHEFLTKQSYQVDHNNSEYDVKVTIGSAAVGMQRWELTIDDLVKLAHFSMIKAREKQLDIMVASEEIRIIKKDLDHFNQEIVQGLHLDEFSPYFFPVIEPKTLQITGCEAFVRWEKNKYRVIDASKFKDIALEKNLFTDIDIRVMEKTFEEYQNW